MAGLHTTPTLIEQGPVLDDVFLRSLIEVPPPADEVSWARRQLCLSAGGVRVEELAREVG